MVDTFFPIDGSAIGVRFTLTDAVPQFPLGTVIKGNKGSVWVYVLAGAAITANTTVHINGSSVANMITAALAITAGQIGTVQNAISNSAYGWAALTGEGLTFSVGASCASSVPLYTTDTAGVLDDATASASHFQVQGVLITATNSGSASTVPGTFNFPIIRRPAP